MSPRLNTEKSSQRSICIADARRFLLGLPGITEGRSYGMPSFQLEGRFFARFRDNDTVMVLQLTSIGEREGLMEIDPRAFFFTEHYRKYPAVLIYLAEIPRALFKDVVKEAWRRASTLEPGRSRKKNIERSVGRDVDQVEKRPRSGQRVQLSRPGEQKRKGRS
jgi:hypothetical protein